MNFSDQIRAASKNIEKKTTAVFRGTALSLFSKIVLRTPVDEGRARGNWQVQINKPPTDTVDSADETGSATIKKGATQAKLANLGDSIYIVNNLPYIKPLEDGSSQQAPTGMVKVTVSEYESIVNEHVRRNK